MLPKHVDESITKHHKHDSTDVRIHVYMHVVRLNPAPGSSYFALKITGCVRQWAIK